MNGWTYACLVVGLLFLAAPAGALIPDNIEILDPNPDDWVTAGDGGSSTVTVKVVNTSGQVSVDFAVDGDYGSISPARVVTDAGVTTATATFRHGTRSGTANITANVSDEVDGPLSSKPIALHIDHATPHKIANIWYKPNATAGETTETVVRMVDKYGNPVDSRREKAEGSDPEMVFFMASSPTEFLDNGSFVDKLWVPVDDDGNATAILRLDTVAGENIVYIQPPKPLLSDMISITGVGGLPVDIKCKVSDASVPADGENTISFTYKLLDEYGNPTAGQGLWVNSSGFYSQQKLINSSFGGEVYVTYGPENNVGIATITATALKNSSVFNTTKVEFVSTDAVKMVVSASPQTMASRDRNPNVVSELRAKVMDVKGNPVDGETVKFTIDNSSITISGGSTSDGNPYLGEVEGKLEVEATTINGSATVKFHPGSFVEPVGNEKPSAKGDVTVRATWTNDTRGASENIELTWVNYPYLSVETEVSNPKVSVNSTDEHATNMTYVTIRLKADGYAMQPPPVDVVLCTDRSGSMLYDNPDRMHSVREAAKMFVDNMSEQDQVGLVTFGRKTGWSDKITVAGESSFTYPSRYIDNEYMTGKKYHDYATVDSQLTDIHSSVKTELDKIVPDSGTPMRAGLYQSIKELCGLGYSTPTSGAVKAVILLSDGDHNWYGDPLARGDSSSSITNYDDCDLKYYEFGDLSDAEQNLSFYARKKNVTIYSIGYANSISLNGTATLKALAETTYGKYYSATAANIAEIYTDIAGELTTNATTDTNMTVFKNVAVNGAPIDAYTVFDYRSESGKSTAIKSWLNNAIEDSPDQIDTTIDQTKNWTDDKQLRFKIGNLQFGQTWEATFCLAVNASYRAGEENNINIFGPGATISFTPHGHESPVTAPFPDTYVTVFPDLTHAELNSSLLAVQFTGPVSDSGPYIDLVPLTWNTTYRGTEGVDVSLAYSRYDDMRSPTRILTRTLDSGRFMTAADNTTTDSTQMDVKDLAPGEYWITVTALARDAETAEDTINVWAHTKGAPRAYIKIE